MIDNGAATIYPVNLLLQDRPCLVVGGGPVAARKVAGLLAAGARVRVVAEKVTADLRQLAAAGRLELVQRSFVAAD
ncbi:MAG: uroporphyrinogen-III C-methyltransferase, partial [Deltaproteobacteria bacterium]|nr:uroporphyrinogen-III C-methyltransferase [Deltaproteobacteria bacterium]